MASENPDDKDGSKNSGEKKYRGVQKKTASTFTARCGSGKNRHIGTFDTAADAARAYDERARELYGAQAALNFPEFHTDDNSSLATESTLPIATPSVSGVQGVPSGRSSAKVKNKGEKRKHIIISDSDAHAHAASPCKKKARSVASRSEFPNIPSEQEELDNFAEYLNNYLSDEESSKSALPTATSSVRAEVGTTGSRIGSSGSTTIAVAEPHAAAEEVTLPTATNNTLPIAESSVTGVASRPESANILSEQEDLNEYAKYLNNLLSDQKGFKSS